MNGTASISTKYNDSVNNNQVLLSIIIPVYNEQFRLSITFEALDQFCAYNKYFQLEIIFVNDGSNDDTEEILKKYISSTIRNIKLISYKENKGKGYAVRQGMLGSKGDYCLMLDADMSTTFSELDKIIPFIINKADVVIGTRKSNGACITAKQPWYRQKMGEIYAFIARFVTRLDIIDFGCGFKIFSRKAVSEIFSKSFINGWIFDTEVLFLAKKMGFQIDVVGVRWKNDENTRVNAFVDAFKSLFDLLRIYIKHNTWFNSLSQNKNNRFKYLNLFSILLLFFGLSAIYLLPYLLHPYISLLDDPWYIASAQKIAILDWKSYFIEHHARVIPFTLFFYTILYKIVNYNMFGFIIFRVIELGFILLFIYFLLRIFIPKKISIVATLFICFLTSFSTNFFELETQDHISLLLLLIFSLLYFKLSSHTTAKKNFLLLYVSSLLVLFLVLLTKETNIFLVPLFVVILILSFLQKKLDVTQIKRINIGYFILATLWLIFLLYMSSQTVSVSGGYSLLNIPGSIINYIKILNFNTFVILYVLVRAYFGIKKEELAYLEINSFKIFLLLISVLSFGIYLPWNSVGDRYMLVPMVFFYVVFFSFFDEWKNFKIIKFIIFACLLSNIFFSIFHFIRFYGSRLADGQLLQYLVMHEAGYDQVCMQISPYSPENVVELNIWLNKVKKLNKKVCTLAKIRGVYSPELSKLLDDENISYDEKVYINNKTWIVLESGSIVYGVPIDSKYNFKPFYSVGYSLYNIHPFRGFEIKKFGWTIGIIDNNKVKLYE